MESQHQKCCIFQLPSTVDSASSSFSHFSPLAIDESNILHFYDLNSKCLIKFRAINNFEKLVCQTPDVHIAKDPYYIGGVLFIDGKLHIANHQGIASVNADLSLNYLVKTPTTNPIRDQQGRFYDTSINVYQMNPQTGETVSIGRDSFSVEDGCDEFDGFCPVRGYVDGSKDVAEFNYPAALAIDKNDRIYVSDIGNEKIRSIDQNFNVDTLPIELDRGVGDLEFDSHGHLIATQDHRIIKITFPF